MDHDRPTWEGIVEFVNHMLKGGRLTVTQLTVFDALVSDYLESCRDRWLSQAADTARESVKRQILFGSMVSADQVAEDVIRLAVTTEPGLAGKGKQ